MRISDAERTEWVNELCSKLGEALFFYIKNYEHERFYMSRDFSTAYSLNSEDEIEEISLKRMAHKAINAFEDDIDRNGHSDKLLDYLVALKTLIMII